MNIQSFSNLEPRLGKRVYIANSSVVIGNVALDDDVAIFPMAVVRGDVNKITIGKRSNIQDGSVLHVNHHSAFNPGGDALTIGDDVTIGHRATLHACRIEDQCLIGINSVIMDKAVVHSQVLIGANSLVPPKKELQSGYLYVGSPVKSIRKLTNAEIAHFAYNAKHYVKLKNQYLQEQSK